MKKQDIQTIKLDLDNLERIIEQICTTLNMPLRKTSLHKFIKEVYGYGNSIKQIDFAILDLVEQGTLVETTFYIASLKCALEERTIPTATEEGIVKLLTSKAFMEEIKTDLFFSPFAPEQITPHNYFKYVKCKYPALLSGKNTGLIYMKQLDELFAFGLSDSFYVEFNDYPYCPVFFSTFFNTDSRIIIKNISIHKKYVTFHLVLLPGKRRSYEKADEHYRYFAEHINSYFETKKVHIKTTPLTMIVGTHDHRRK